MAPVPARTPKTARVATLNVWGHEADPVIAETRYEALRSWVTALDVDALCMQEVYEACSTWPSRLSQDTHLGFYFAPGEHISGCAIASRWPLVDTGALQLPEPAPVTKVPPRAATSVAVYATTGPGLESGVHLVTAHLAWGPLTEYTRLQQAVAVNEWAERYGPLTDNQGPVVVWAGDFNAEPEHDVLRWVHGKSILPYSPYASTRWTDAWDHSITRYGDGITSSARNIHARTTATRSRRIEHPDLLPDRRIDYLLIRGYRHGTPGTPLAAGLWGQKDDSLTDVSDHYGIWADLLF